MEWTKEKIIGGSIAVIIVIVLIILLSTGVLNTSSSNKSTGAPVSLTVTPASNKYTSEHPAWTK